MWLEAVSGYTIAGAISSAAVGFTLGAFGALTSDHVPTQVWRIAAFTTLAVATVATILREFGWAPIPLVQRKRQTRGLWAHQFGIPRAAVLWGFDLGLLFTTWLTLSGVWVLALAAFVLAQPVVAVALVVAYWLGRAASVWVSPLLLRDPGRPVELLLGISSERGTLARVHVLAIVGMAVAIALAQASVVE